ncbi:MAG: YegS/Rv2252/BmrU family lipid kinase [Bacilli bacterium]|nr:YegS/Rv2252/BmrU family lipid kinase [Bacilli bacterium]
MKCVMIINPKSGRGFNKKNTEKIVNIIKQYNYEPEIFFTKYRGHATEIIKSLSDDVDLVISSGGDGTFSEVMNGNLKRNKPLVLSHLPVGTMNDIGHMYGLVSNLYTNLKLILTGTVKNIDVGLINNRAFTYVASYGKFMDIPYQTPQELKKRLGFLAYFIEVLKRIYERIPKYDVEFEIDGEKHQGKYSFILISNANHIAGINNFYKDMKLDDNMMEVMFCSLYKKRDILKAFYNLKTNNLTGVSGIECYKGSELEIKLFGKKKSWCVDGEEYKSKNNSYKISLINNVKLQIPSKNIKKLFLK